MYAPEIDEQAYTFGNDLSLLVYELYLFIFQIGTTCKAICIYKHTNIF